MADIDSDDDKPIATWKQPQKQKQGVKRRAPAHPELVSEEEKVAKKQRRETTVPVTASKWSHMQHARTHTRTHAHITHALNDCSDEWKPIEIVEEKWGPEPGTTRFIPYSQRLYLAVFRQRSSGNTKVQWAVAEDNSPNKGGRKAKKQTGWADEAPEWEPVVKSWRATEGHETPPPQPQLPSKSDAKSRKQTIAQLNGPI
jgi:hypothetical protein